MGNERTQARTRQRLLSRRRLELLGSDASCYYCNARVIDVATKEHPKAATLDHKQPTSRGGTDADDNTVLACYQCNQAKGDMTEAEFYAYRQERMVGKSKREALMLAVLECLRPKMNSL